MMSLRKGPLNKLTVLFALVYSVAWDGRWSTLVRSAACVLFTLGILVS